jgi:amino acid adenylation domain-containing protein
MLSAKPDSQRPPKVSSPPVTLAQLVQRAAYAHPNRPAVVSGTDRLTWSETDHRCRQLVAVLMSLGVQRGDRVALFVPKSVNSMIAVHGVMQSGAAYVPVDPLSPSAVLATVLTSAQARVLVTDQRLTRTVTEALNILREAGEVVPSVIGADLDQSAATFVSWEAVASATAGTVIAVDPTDLAYVMFTSGSTGTPKGIAHTHGSGLEYAIRAAETYNVQPTDRLANSAPLHFDISTFELFAGPLVGACSLMIPEPYLKMPASLSKLMADEHVTFWYSVPSLLTELATRGVLEERDLSSLRWVIFGGEVVSPAVVRRLMTLWPDAKFSNSYGPAEVNQCTYYHLPGKPPDSERVPIGIPWRDAYLQISDESGKEVPVGTVGQLLVSTPTMMSGYWGRPDLTDRSIVRDKDSGKRWYATGDLVHRDEAGVFHFHGRLDNQVKVRGNRIELESVEAALVEVAGVIHAVAAVRGVGVDARLVSVVVVEHDDVLGPALDTTGVLRAAANLLPRYALPDELTIVTALPLTPSGKLDKSTVRLRLQQSSQPTSDESTSSTLNTIHTNTPPQENHDV